MYIIVSSLINKFLFCFNRFYFNFFYVMFPQFIRARFYVKYSLNYEKFVWNYNLSKHQMVKYHSQKK